MLRKFINSEFFIENVTDGTVSKFLSDDKQFIIQSEVVGCWVSIEYCLKENIPDLIPFNLNQNTPKTVNKGDSDKVQEYREVVIMNDPLGKYNGCSIGDVFDAKDTKWIDWCLKNMKNSFIKDRVKYIAEYYEI